MIGKQRTQSNLAVRRGNSGDNRPATFIAPPGALPAIPPPPKSLTPAEAHYWSRIAGYLFAQNNLTSEDTELITDLAICRADIDEIMIEVRTTPPIIITAQGVSIHPIRKLLMQQQALAAKLRAELGIGSANRERSALRRLQASRLLKPGENPDAIDGDCEHIGAF